MLGCYMVALDAQMVNAARPRSAARWAAGYRHCSSPGFPGAARGKARIAWLTRFSPCCIITTDVSIV